MISSRMANIPSFVTQFSFFSNSSLRMFLEQHFAAGESYKNESGRRPDNRKAQKQGRRFNNTGSNSRKKYDSGFNKNFKRIITKPKNNNSNGTEVFEIGSDAPRFGKTNSRNRRFGENYQKRFINSKTNKNLPFRSRPLTDYANSSQDSLSRTTVKKDNWSGEVLGDLVKA